MNYKVALYTLLFHACLHLTAQANPPAVHLSIAASMTSVLKETITAFSANHPEVRVLPNFGSSGSLAKQIVQGAPADIYVSANPEWMQYLVENEMIAAGSTSILACNTLVFISEREWPGLGMDRLDKLDLIALGNPDNVPVGQYAKQAMERVSIYQTLQQEKKLVLAKDARQALIYADRGEVDGAFVYKTDAALARRARIQFNVPRDYYDRVAYPLALTISGASNDMAKTLYAYLTGPETAFVLQKFGFEPCPE